MEENNKNEESKKEEKNEKKIIKITLLQLIIILLIVIFVCIFLYMFILRKDDSQNEDTSNNGENIENVASNVTNESNEIEVGDEEEKEYIDDSGINMVYTKVYNGGTYYIFEDDDYYLGEYDLQEVAPNEKMSEEINGQDEFSSFSIMNYSEYANLCDEYSIDRKYDDEDLTYIVYKHFTEYSTIYSRLGAVTINNGNATFYLFEQTIIDDYAHAGYGCVVIVPTDEMVTSANSQPVIPLQQYNDMVANDINQ